MADVFVAGSVNQDFVLKVGRRPEPGETVTDAKLLPHPGGKGANQAVAAALLGAKVTLLGRVGADNFGEALIQNLREKGVGITRVEILPEVSTGVAFITVTPDGENAITVAPGANEHLTPKDVDAATEDIRRAQVLMAQMEIPATTVQRAVEVAADCGTRVVLNLAPARELPKSVLQVLNPLVVNEHEASFLLERRVEGVEAALEAASSVLSLGPQSAVLTLGDAGAVVATEEGSEHYPAPKVSVVDTTGAGDAFVGALVVKLADGAQIGSAVAYAVQAAAMVVTKDGAQGSLPMLGTIIAI